MAAAAAVAINQDEENQYEDGRTQEEPVLDENGKPIHELARELLIERLKLEKALFSGLRMIVLCGALFSSLIMTHHYQTDKSAQFALQQSYSDTFDLSAAGDIVAPYQLRNHLRLFSEQIRTLQVLSSEFFVEREGQLKILGGIKDFTEAQVIEVADLMPRVDTASFTFMAWVQRDSVDSSGYIVRKPLGRGRERALSCYGWHIGSVPSIVFGAHDVGLVDQSLNEERVAADGEWEVDHSFHLEMIVVNRTTVSFFRDSKLRSSLPLRRPITDCSGGSLMIGDKGLRMAEVTFYARSLSQTEIEEIFFAGFTFEAIAAGKVPFHPQETEFDRLLGAQDEAVSTLLTSNDHALAQAALGRVLTQALIKGLQDGPASPVLPVSGNPEPGCTTDWPPCQVIRNVTDTLSLDSYTGKQYYNLIPPEARSGGGAQDPYAVPPLKREQMLHYEPATFPTWAGGSASFSVWVVPGMLGTLLAKSASPLQVEMCWSLFIDPTWGMGSQGSVIASDGWVHPHLVYRWGGNVAAGTGYEPIHNNGQKFRHLAWVFDAATNSMRIYVDGALVNDMPFPDANTVGRLDCANSDTTYIGFAHRAPGGLQYIGQIRDFRMYKGVALTTAEVHGLSEGEGSSAKRECSLSTEGQDANYKDMNGNNCAWYQEAVSETAAVCTASAVREQCPVACGDQEPCFEPEQASAPTYQIWEKIMRIQPRIEGVGSLCVRQGFNPAGACMAAMARRDPLSYPPDGSPWTNRFTSLAEGGLGEWNLTNCELLYAMTDPSCSFKVPGQWTSNFDAEAAASGEWTISFWFKGSKDAALVGQGVDLWMTFYSSVAPPVPLARIVGYSGIMIFQIWGGAACGLWTEDVNMAVSYEPGEWVQMALSFGAQRGPNGERHMQLVKDSVYVVDVKNRPWCPPEPGQEFIQAISILHSFEALISPIQVTARAQSVKAVQLEYYQLRPSFRWRRGPSSAEATRLSRPVTYQENQFDAPGALLAPPILLQRRLQRTSECAVQSGSDFQEKVWRDATLGMTCSEPYECSDALMGSSSQLLRCRGKQIAERFLGRAPLTVRGQEVFAEFLPSIADASILVRDGELFETSTFIDTQTESMVLPVVLFAPNVGVLTLISIEASFSSRVDVKYNVKQFQAVEGEKLDASLMQAAITLAIVALSLVELGIQFFSVVRSWQKVGRKEHEGRQLKFIIADVVVLAVIPVLYLALRINQLKDSSAIMSKATGADGLGGVPWASTSMPLDEKMDRFFSGLEDLQGHIDREERMTVLGFAAAVLLLIRVILATQAHPRTAVLVHTIICAADDLWHFGILFLVLFLGFGALAFVSFGMRVIEFATLGSTFETLFDMMLGSLPKGGGGGTSKSWTGDPLLIIFVALFNFLVFFVMLNFIIAIIVESYLFTKKRLEDEITEQEFITDIVASLNALIKRLMLRWPTHSTLIKTLSHAEEETVNEEVLAVHFKEWDAESIAKFVAHYEEYDFLCPAKIVQIKGDKLEGVDLVNEIEHRFNSALSRAANGSPVGGTFSPLRATNLPSKSSHAASSAKQVSHQGSANFQPTVPAEIATETATPGPAGRKGAWAESERGDNAARAVSHGATDLELEPPGNEPPGTENGVEEPRASSPASLPGAVPP